MLLVNSTVRAKYSDSQHRLISLKVDGENVSDTGLYKICFQGYHGNNSEAYLNISQKELLESGNAKLVCTSAKEVLEEYLRNHQNLKRIVEDRLVYLQ